MTPPDVSVVICTHSRLAMLRDAVDSVLTHATVRGLAFEIVVSDNSPHGHAEDYVAELDDPRVRWVPSQPSNISVARNAGIAAARADLVAFADDDLEVAPGWLDHLVDTLREGDFDSVIGPVHPRFEAGEAPAWDPAGSRYTRVFDAPNGTPIVVAGPDRSPITLSTASSLWRAETCFTDPEPFAPAFGACGGEDFDLMWRLEQRGRTFGWCATGEVTETIPASRTDLRYQALRAYSGGQVFAALVARHSERGRIAVVEQMARGLAQMLLAGVLMLLGLAIRTATRGRNSTFYAKHLLLAAAGAGKLTWFRTVPLYQVEEAQRGSAGRSPAGP